MDIEDSKIAVLLRSFSQPELEKFENFVKSPFFNASSQITNLFEILKSDYPEFRTLGKAKIFKSLYPKEDYKDKKIRDLFSRLLKLAEEYLAQIEFQKTELTFNRHILKQYSLRNLERHFSTKVKDAESRLEKEKHHGSNFYYEKYALLKVRREYFETLKFFGKGKEFFEDFSLEIELFNDYILFNVLNYGIHLETHKKTFRFDYDYVMLEMILSYLKRNPEVKDQVINLMYHIVALTQNPEDLKVYFEIRKLLEVTKPFLEEDALRLIMVDLFNFTKVYSLKDNPQLKKENYNLLKESIELGMYPKEGNYLAESSYITVAATALLEKDFGWALDFMDKYKSLLNPEIAENAHRYCRSVYDYRLGNYDAALKGLAKVSLDDFYYQMRVKNHQLKIYYETGNYESALNLIDSFRHFLSTSKFLPEFVRIRFSNYVNITSRIVNIRLGGSRANIPEIIRDIEGFNPEVIENKSWLLEQISKMET
jgi:hypothetical protein